MNSMFRIVISVTISALLPATAMAQKVSYDDNTAQDFARLKTYTFRDCTKTDNPFVDERIVAAVAGQLEARGMTRDDTNPDVYVTTRQTFENQKEYQVYSTGYPYGWGWGYGYGYWWGPQYTDVRVKDIIKGTLTVDLKNSSNDQLVWRGVGVRTVNPLSKPSHVNKKVNHQVTKIFRSYPPN